MRQIFACDNFESSLTTLISFFWCATWGCCFAVFCQVMIGRGHDQSAPCDAASGQQQRGGRGERPRCDSPVASNTAASSASDVASPVASSAPVAASDSVATSPVANHLAASSSSISAVIASSPLLLIADWRLVTAGAVMRHSEYRLHG